MDLTLPLDHATIERILPHRYPFLLVDRITEFGEDKRIVGIKNVSYNERYSRKGPRRTTGHAADHPHGSRGAGRGDSHSVETGKQAAPAAVCRHPEGSLPQAGLPGRLRRNEATVIRLRNRMGLLRGVARVNGETVVHGSMTFALAPAQTEASAS